MVEDSHARLACGCRVVFRDTAEGSPYLIVVDAKSAGCPSPLHVRDLPALRLPRGAAPADALPASEEEGFEEES